ncbi:hypothetical protein QBC40DRAFT_317802 [Triangularia verruculosa]|uniref:Uncharacterized protein n=1 Tax=Triangularia verruculosa TaxID=2587418 RepID=A0AAN6X7K9_9PEZI|nr:hypothetical protein QBC40DRAFT_317802 [Triangularia verruculosa]
MSPHRPILLASTLFLLLFSSCIGGVEAQEPTCYDTWGNKDSNQMPCYGPGSTSDTKTITHCCNKNDYCLSNGLCMSPQANNLMTQQGCTDKDWNGSSCNRFCQPQKRNNLLSSIPLIPCPATFNSSNGLQFCCGNNPEEAATCCESSVSISIPTGTLLLPSSPSPSDSPSSTTSETLKIGLGIGLGIGIPIFAVLLVVAYLLAHPRYPPSTSSSSRSRSAQQHQAKHRYHSSNLSSGWHLRAPSRTTVRGGYRGHEKRDSFGRVDTNVGPPSDDGDWAARTGGPDSAAWPPTGTNVAAAIAAWANINASHLNNDDVPPSPKEMDARSRAGSRLRHYFRGETPTPGRYELPAEGTDQKGRKIGVGVREMAAVGDRELPACPDYSEEPGVGTMGTTGTIGPDSMTINVGAMPVTPMGVGTMNGTMRGEQVSPLTAVEGGQGTFSGGTVLDKVVSGEVMGQGHER